ncbi:MAG: dgdA [Naasia sp.]|uniref:aminotransferase n=1 Tax=Naasia sp. TaxID=2546198 RepID=UPI002603A13D|nr:aminotransferase [Naasia sp.]MCU1571551.1 dgdA [Naasia sp.]
MTSDFLSSPSLPRPRVSPDEAKRIAEEHFGLSGEVRELGSNQDRNFLVESGGGRYVLKLANPAFDVAELEAQNEAMERAVGAGYDVPRAVQSTAGATVLPVALRDATLHTRLLTFVEGEPLAARGAFSRAEARGLGAASGALARALEGFSHPGLSRTTQWNLRVASDVVALLLDSIQDGEHREAIRAAVLRADAQLAPLREHLRVQAVHGDVTDDNVVSDGTAAVSGIIDFGDVAEGWLVGELAVTCAAILHHNPAQPLLVLEAAEAFHALTPLTEHELAALWPLVTLRTAVLVVSGEQQVALDGDNEYADLNRAHEWTAFQAAAGADADQLTALLRWRLLGEAVGAALGGEVPLVHGLAPESVLDLSVTSRALRAGAWLEPDAERVVAAGLVRGTGSAVTRWGEHRLTRTGLRTAGDQATLALGVELFLPAGTPVRAPVDGTVRVDGDAVLLAAEGVDLRLSGVEPTAGLAGEVAAGTVLGSAAGDADGMGRVVVQACRVPGITPPLFALPADRDLWLSACPDPSALLGIPVAAPQPDAGDVLRQRNTTFAQVQEHYYAAPPLIERGWQEHLIDTEGRSYLDLVNNVAAVGHGHPRLVEAVSDQWALLNTNSRFHYSALSRFTERLAALTPDPLDTVFLVNSGSEAVDLAIRLATAYTGQPTVLAVREAYHGWTIGSDAVSSSIGDNPRALETRPSWVELLDAPHAYRGRYRGASSAPDYLRDLELDLERLDEEGRGVAAFLAEPVFGNAGGVLLPDGYLQGAYEAVRRRGGLCIADEVQVGYGRLGAHFWGFEQQGVVPDIVTVAKAMGSGHPLGAVITRRDIAERFAREGSMFSSAGGSPVSCVVGLTVLDVLEDEGLQENAQVVGGHLKAGLEALGARHPLIGAVHGMGLYLGVELVLDRTTLAPATAAAEAICDELLAEGCIVQPTGDHKNVLKIKPPMCLTAESADFFLAALERVLERHEPA